MGLAYLPFLHSVQMVSPECPGNVIHIRSRLTYICTLGRLLTIPGSSLGTKFRKVRTFSEHSLCDGVHQGDTRGVWVLLESEPVLDFPHGPNALVMRRCTRNLFVLTFTTVRAAGSPERALWLSSTGGTI